MGRNSISTAVSFAYSRNHPATPLPALSFAAMAGAEDWSADDRVDAPHDMPMNLPADMGLGRQQMLSRDGLCSAIVAVAQANDLPIPFFANLIWQESSFESKTVSTAGALGIAQFMPDTAVERGLINPFETVHALFASGKLLRKLTNQFGNLGLAAAAYNAGPQRVTAWMAERKTLPSETRAYVMRITGHPADQWLSNEILHDPYATLMPARAPCVEVQEEVKAQLKLVRVARLVAELAAATEPPPTVQIAGGAPSPVAGAKPDRSSHVATEAALSKKKAGVSQKPEVASGPKVQMAGAKIQDRIPRPATKEFAKGPKDAANLGRKRVAAQ
jgi:hypothetical protein